MTNEEREDYWKTQSSLSTVSATTPTYADACDMLGYDRVYPTPFASEWQKSQAATETPHVPAVTDADDAAPPVAKEPGAEVLLLNGWQVTGVAWAIRQENLPIRGGMIADDCGTGKTVIMLTVILEQYRTARIAHAQGAKGPWKPTLVIAPPHVVDVWFQEVQRFFSSELEIWRFYETKDKVTNATMKARTLPSTATALVSWLDDKCPPDSPWSCAKVIVTAYETFTLRTLMEKAGGKAKGMSVDYSLALDYSLLARPHLCSVLTAACSETGPASSRAECRRRDDGDYG
jgi:hypothetical protein